MIKRIKMMEEARMEETRMKGRMEATKGGRERGARREFERQYM